MRADQEAVIDLMNENTKLKEALEAADSYHRFWIEERDARLKVEKVNEALVKALERARRDVFNDIVLKEIDTALSLAKGKGHGS